METSVPIDLLEDIVNGFDRLRNAAGLAEQAVAYESLSNDMADLSSYHPRFDYESGVIVEES